MAIRSPITALTDDDYRTVAPDRPCWATKSAWALSYSAVKLFSKNSNLFDHGT